MKTRLFSLAALLAVALALSGNVNAQVWESTLSLPAPHHQSIGLNLNGTLVSLGGLPLKANLGLVDDLTPGANSWLELSHRLVDDTAGLGAGVDSLGRIIVFGGRSPSTGAATLNGYVYDLVTGPGAAIAPKNLPVYDFAVATDDQHRVYAIGGAPGSGQATDSMGVERYDARSNAWTILASLPAPRTKAVAAYDGQGHVLVFGGNPPGGNPTTTVFSYDITSNVWSQLADVPLRFTGPVNGGAVVLGADGFLYLVGPGNSVFEPRFKLWLPSPRQQIVRGSPGAVLGGDGFIYVMGGDNNTVQGGLLNSVERLDTAHTPPILGSFAISGGCRILTWSSISNRIYRVNFKDDLGAAWSDLTGDIVANSPTSTVTDCATSSARFYRIQMLP